MDVVLCLTCFNIQKHCIFSMECIHVILTIISIKCIIPLVCVTEAQNILYEAGTRF
jgi:hypothetical protein